MIQSTGFFMNEADDEKMKGKAGQPFLPYSACAFLMIMILILDLFIPLGAAAGVMYVAVILLSLWAHRKRFTVFVAAVCSLLVIAGYYFSPSGGIPWQVIFNRSVALFAIWVTAVLTLQRKSMEEKRIKAVAEREKSLDDIKVLQGLLPICSSCHKIRDDKGYWSRIELYIRDHSEADFTHGLCPECAERLYPVLRKHMGSE